jgi:hypothetical protein
VTVGRSRSSLLVSTQLPVKARPQDSRFAANEAAQRKVGMRTLARCSVQQTARQNRLDAIKQLFGDQRFEVAALSAYAVLGHIHDAGVELIEQQDADRLRRERFSAPIGRPQALAAAL